MDDVKPLERTRMIRWILVALLAFAAPQACLAWNDTGHMTVALIAYRQLDDAHRQKVDAVLKAHPHYALFLAADRAKGVNEGEWAFMRAAVWPDYVRPSRPGTPDELFKGRDITRYHHGDWHYIDIPWVYPMDRAAIDPTTRPARSATRPTENILTALQQNSSLLGGAETDPADRAVALAWLEHLTGDLHQPLHACGAYSAEFPSGDRGGGERAVRANGNVMRLHVFWDESIGNSDAHLAIDFIARQIAEDPQLAREKLVELSSDATFATWAQESHELAVALAHLNGRLKSVPYSAYESKKISDDAVPPLPPSYLSNARDVARRRVAVAGYRLADEITRLVKP
jgi:hypothetical protein